MTAVKSSAIVAGLTLGVVLGVLIYSTLARRAFHRAAVIRDSGILLGFVDTWRKEGEQGGQAVESLLANYGSTKPFIYTNVVNVGGTNFVCAFAEPGMLAVTREGTIIGIEESGAKVIPINR